MARTAAAEESTNTASAAPRESASSPSAPEPAKRSSTRSAVDTRPSTENSASRTRSEVGRVREPAGATSRRPPKRPATILTPGSARAPRRRSVAQRGGEQHVLGLLELGVGLDDPLRGAREPPRAAPGRARLRPDWRVPMSSPSPAQAQVHLGEPEAVAVLGQRAQARGLLGPEEQAQRLVLAAADAPAQLVQLGDAVALGVLDQHHGRVRDVDPDLDHRRGDEHVGVAGGEARHRRLLLARAHLAVEQHDAEVAELGAREALVLGAWPRAPAAPRTPRRAGRRRTPAARRAAPRGCARRRARARARRRRRGW